MYDLCIIQNARNELLISVICPEYKRDIVYYDVNGIKVTFISYVTDKQTKGSELRAYSDLRAWVCLPLIRARNSVLKRLFFSECS